MGENDYPKLDGHIHYGSEANHGVYGRKGATTTYGRENVGYSGTSIRVANTNRVSLMVYNNTPAGTIFMGGTSVGTSTGFPLKYQEFRTFEAVNIIHAISDSGTSDIRWVEVSK